MDTRDVSERLELRPLRLKDEPSFMAAIAEFQAEGAGFDFALGWNQAQSFSHYVSLNEAWERGEDLPAGYVPAGFYVGVVNGEVVGRLSARFELNEYLAKMGGHLGYGVRPSYRNRGYATAMLRQAIELCAARGLNRMLLTCDVTNVHSARVIERCGGVFECLTAEPSLEVQKRRYWIGGSMKQ